VYNYGSIGHCPALEVKMQNIKKRGITESRGIEYWNTFVTIWQSSDTRDHALERINKELDENTSAKTMMGQVRYIRSKGIELKKIAYVYPKIVDWDLVKEHFHRIETGSGLGDLDGSGSADGFF
jgi:hypothetical protein